MPFVNTFAEKNAVEIPEEALAAMGMDTVEVKRLVDEYLEAQSLKILPQAPFGDAVREFVQNDDKYAMERFIQQSLSSQVKNMLSLDGDEEDLDSAMEKYKSQVERRFKAGVLKSSRRKATLPKPDAWDSDLEGHWEDQPGVVKWEQDSVDQQPEAATSSGRGLQTAIPGDDDEEMDDVEEEPAPKPRGRGKAAAKPVAKATVKAAPKAAAKKAPAKGRGRKAAVFQEDDSDDNISIDANDRSPEPPAKRIPSTRSQPSRAAASASKPTQSKLNFSQKPSQAMEISDDEISDDPFETAPVKKTRKR